MRIIHTADWHLGHTLHDRSRLYEHEHFLSWLEALIETEQADALIVAGDVFDKANPSAEAQQAYYSFLTRARERMPALDVVVVGGNHDSAGRLDAPSDVLVALGVHVVGGLSARDNLDRAVVPLRGADGAVAAWVCAVPFLRPGDLPRVTSEDPLVDGVRALYAEVLEQARRKKAPGQAIVATGHLYMAGGALSELSERRILGGNQHALPADIFPPDVVYAALGHLHKPQKVGGQAHIRYSGSPIPLSFSEVEYQHQALIVDIDGEALREVRHVLVPRAVDLLRLPAGGAATLEEVEAVLEALPERGDCAAHALPFLEVSVRLDEPVPGLRARIETALEGRRAQLARLVPVYTGTGRAAAEATQTELREIQPEEVFRLRYERDHEGAPSPELLDAFHELVESVQSGRTSDSAKEGRA